MPPSEVRTALERHLQAIFDFNLDHYHASTVPELQMYEWYITPHRIDGLPFHDFLMQEAQRAGAVPLTGTGLFQEGGAAAPLPEPPRVRFDLANYAEQRYGDTAIASYTLLVSTSAGSGTTVVSYNESRVMVKFPDAWKIVHVHKSPTYKSPLTPP